MRECQEINGLINIYLDGEFDEQEATRIRAHLAICPSCSDQFEKQQRFLALLRGNEPKEEVPQELEVRIKTKLRKRKKLNALKIRGVYATLLILLALLGPLLYLSLKKSSSDQSPGFVINAINDYKSYLRGELPMEIQSSQIEEVTEWFKNKVNFNPIVPSFHNKNVKLIGGRLTSFQRERVAFLIYELNGYIISLSVTAEQKIDTQAAKKNTFKDIDFYLFHLDGYNAILWNHLGLSYSLVSNLPEEGRKACIVCHDQDTQDVNIHRFLDWST